MTTFMPTRFSWRTVTVSPMVICTCVHMARRRLITRTERTTMKGMKARLISASSQLMKTSIAGRIRARKQASMERIIPMLT